MDLIGYFKNFGITDAISLAALGWSIYTYIKHGQRLKKQESEINEYIIKENKEKEEAKKKAVINCTILDNDGSSGILRVYNEGIADAEDINITIDDQTESAAIIHDALEYPLLTQYAKYNIHFNKFTNIPDRSNVTVCWKDKLGKHKREFVLTF